MYTVVFFLSKDLDMYSYLETVLRLCVCYVALVWLFVILWTVACQATLPWDFLDKNTRLGCHFLLQEIFPTQASTTPFTSPVLAGRFYTASATLVTPLEIIYGWFIFTSDFLLILPSSNFLQLSCTALVTRKIISVK